MLYGKNGSGKSTISKVISKAKGELVEEIMDATLYDHEGKVYTDVQNIHVFNEDYINSRVKLRQDGLNTIVLLGEIGDLEDKIIDLELRIEAESKRNVELKKNSDEYKYGENSKSPSYCRLQINLGLSGETHWAEREKIINDGKRNASVNDRVIDSIIALSPAETLEELRRRYNENLELLNQVRKNEAGQIRNTIKLNVTYDEATLQASLSQRVERPMLSEREQYLFQLIDDGKLEQINEMKMVFSKKSTSKCPFWFQDVSDLGKQDLISSIEKVLSKEIDTHEENLKKCILQEVKVDLTGMEVLNSEDYIKCLKVIEDINTEILKNVYDYACGESENSDRTIGNSMRRVLEAFSTFVYKKGIVEISYDNSILEQMKDTDYIEYFKNLMYRLVLNGESHMEERTNSLGDMDYFDFLSNQERQRTAREVLCFIYLLNEKHVLAHLDGKKDVVSNLKKWCAEIKSFCTGEEVTE